MITDQKNKSILFKELHYSKEILMLPNIWDPLGALLLEDIGFPAVATASASVAFANGYNDGENISFDDLIRLLANITNRVAVPVSADIESGYARDLNQLEENIYMLIEAGVAGINIEDTDAKTDLLLPANKQCEKIAIIRKAAGNMNAPLFINARTDVFIGDTFTGTGEEKLKEAITRGKAYKDAGADGFYPILLNDENAIKEIIETVSLPANIMMMPGIPGLATLQQIGVKRISLGPGFLKIGIRAMKDIASRLRKGDGVEEVTSNEITSGYLKKLVSKSPNN